MFKKNSIFVKILIPVIAVMLVQTLLISLVLFANGTIDSLGDGAIESMRKNTENRSLILENMMVSYWSNLEKLEADTVSVIGAYLRENGITIDEALGNSGHETNLLRAVSDSMISTLRQTSSTGVCLCFLDIGEPFTGEWQTLRGLYYRDLDPVSVPADHSDILFLRGPVEIARKDKIQLDSLWEEQFTLAPDDPGVWESFTKPQLAAIGHPEAASVDLSYWSGPHLIKPNLPADMNRCVTYTRPLFYEGRVIAILGTEVQAGLLEKYFPAGDFDTSGKTGYMLVEYARDTKPGDTVDCSVFMVTGSYVKRIIASRDRVLLTPTHREGVYTMEADDVEDVRIVLAPLRLYNTNAPFSGEQWALAAIGADSALFASANNVKNGILYSSVFALLAGSLLLAVLVRVSTRPLISIANQIEKSDPVDPIVVSDSNTYEVALLCSTINAMREKRSHVEEQLREERERYLVALENAADTFMEYDIAQDSFLHYQFFEEEEKPQVISRVIPQFMEKVAAGEICHREDIGSLTRFMLSKTPEPIEVRVKTSLFSHLTVMRADGEYYWILLKASRIYDGDGNVTKVIGSAREITEEKLREYARIETTRRDPTTGLYNYEYGMQLLKSYANSEENAHAPYAACVLHIDHFEGFEAYYGRVFAGAILVGFSRELLGITKEGDLCVRLTNDEFLLLLGGVDREIMQAKAALLAKRLECIYTGENADLRFSVSIGAALSENASECAGLLQNAWQAARFAAKSGGGRLALFGELSEEEKREDYAGRERPVSVSLEITKESIGGFVFELFEHTADIHSAVNMLISILGGLYGLRQVIICSFDADFGADRLSYQWNREDTPPYHAIIEKVSHKDFKEFETLLNEDGALLYRDEWLEGRSEGIRRLLCTVSGEKTNAYCCAMYENATHTGRILFKAGEKEKTWQDAELITLQEVTKIIAAHLSIEKSNSASRAKSEFLSRISHEIRTPMNAILGMTEIAKNSIRDTAHLSECLDKIDFSANHLLSLINDVLEMSRIESGKLTIETKPFALAEFIAGIDTLMRPPIESKGLTFLIDNACGDIGLLGDEYRLRQVLVNLLGNANKFTESGGTIEFSVEELDEGAFREYEAGKGKNPPPPGAQGGSFGYFRFSVKDNGIGISLEDQPNIFRAFEQAENNSDSQKRQGTGLGLAISGNIISAMGSKIELHSKPGEGSEFYFILRMEHGEGFAEATPRKAEAVDYSGCLSGRRGLLVEDNEINMEIALYVLEETGLQIDVARDGQEAVDRFLASSEGYYNVILMDIQMPVMDGLTATRNIRKNTQRSDARTTPIIAMTANAFDEDMKKSIESGMNGHVAKPIDKEKLFALLKTLICGKEGSLAGHSGSRMKEESGRPYAMRNTNLPLKS